MDLVIDRRSVEAAVRVASHQRQARIRVLTRDGPRIGAGVSFAAESGEAVERFSLVLSTGWHG